MVQSERPRSVLVWSAALLMMSCTAPSTPARSTEEISTPARSAAAPSTAPATPREVARAEVDRDALIRYVQTQQEAIRQCYEQELKHNPNLQGSLVVFLTIKPTGRTDDVQIKEDTLRNEGVANCVRTLVRGWVFPFTLDEEVSVEYPFVFQPAQ